MNERLFKLAGQAISEVSVPLDFKHEHFLFATKFAELIVRECINTVLDSSVEYTTRPQIAEELKEHFGVEE